ncbi:YARHG domain-containing protein [Galbibacter sp. EGI 63066]|uniref:YARHG domain-containing protein n=1 Tax=Galbibacter sp. EGI 63066 TaxID=2993559 RepID=UPI0022499EA6|nr:YARHG domain-containing protein [Galbibacter sp. EGI 63066]MCX2679284.1 YARHG domain-containing protein [Galbibacter sp. EGI 63066]
MLILTFSVFGNDGAYLTRGSVIYPTQETKISLEKEILSFKIKDRVAYVNIQFEFNNPENTDRKLLIGFQAPTAAGDVSDSLSNLNQINNFTIIQNGKILPYQLKAAECEDCELKDPKDFHFSQSETGIFVFLFEITFKPGLNQINHSYNFPASSNVSFDRFYNYILTTGSKWAGGKIKDLTVNIDMGQNQYFYVNDIFGQTADWSIIGSGKVINKKFNYIDNGPYRMVRVLSGQLQIKVTDFQPTKNIEFGVISKYAFYSSPVDYGKAMMGEIISIRNLTLETNHSKSQLRLLRNTIYARYGYDFDSPDLKEYFSQFAWYMPDPNLKMEDIKLTEKEKAFVEKILMKEKN